MYTYVSIHVYMCIHVYLHTFCEMSEIKKRKTDISVIIVDFGIVDLCIFKMCSIHPYSTQGYTTAECVCARACSFVPVCMYVCVCVRLAESQSPPGVRIAPS